MVFVVNLRRIGDLNTGQLRLLVKYCETKIPSLNNKTILDAYGKLLNKATAEADRRHEEEVRLSFLINARTGDIVLVKPFVHTSVRNLFDRRSFDLWLATSAGCSR